ncbi:MAG: hypothetical protein ACK502_08410 [Alphaproteobacteria bacterium]
MGLWSGLKDTAGSLKDGFFSGREAKADAKAAEWEVRAAKAERFGEAVGEIRPVKGAWNAGKAGVKGVFSGARKAVKFGAIGAALVAGAAAVGIMANRSRKAAAGAAQDDIANAPNTVEVPESVIPQMMPPQPTEVGPADGRAPGEWVSRVAADRGGVDLQNPAAQPKMSVVPDSAVQDIGSATPAQPAR